MLSYTCAALLLSKQINARYDHLYSPIQLRHRPYRLSAISKRWIAANFHVFLACLAINVLLSRGRNQSLSALIWFIAVQFGFLAVSHNVNRRVAASGSRSSPPSPFSIDFRSGLSRKLITQLLEPLVLIKISLRINCRWVCHKMHSYRTDTHTHTHTYTHVGTPINTNQTASAQSWYIFNAHCGRKEAQHVNVLIWTAQSINLSTIKETERQTDGRRDRGDRRARWDRQDWQHQRRQRDETRQWEQRLKLPTEAAAETEAETEAEAGIGDRRQSADKGDNGASSAWEQVSHCSSARLVRCLSAQQVRN